MSYRLLMSNLPDLYVHATVSFNDKNYEESRRILDDGLSALFQSIDLQAIPETMYNRLQAIKTRIETIATNKAYHEITGILNHLKQIYMYIPA